MCPTYDYEFFQRSDSVWHHLTMDSFERPRPSREMMGTMTDDVDDAGVGFECMDPGMA